MFWFRRPFRITIRSYSEFALLCALIHGSELPSDRVKLIIERLHKATRELKEASRKSRKLW